MLLIRCPHCGPRPESDFRYGHEAHIARPEAPDQLDDAAWADFVFLRSNPRGWHRERWMHAAGCRRWFNVVRSTVTHEIIMTYRPGERPALPDGLDEGGKR
ncbi:MAG: sarcosine oxidase subunit delta [Hyphomicrobiaceae bacterium]